MNELIKLANQKDNILLEPKATIVWEIDEYLEGEFQQNRAINPFMIIIIASQSQGSIYYQRIWQYHLIPIFERKCDLKFSLPGKYEIYGKVIWDKYKQKPKLDTITLLGHSGIKINEPTQHTYHRGFIQVKVDQEFFCKSRYEKWKWHHPIISKLLNNVEGLINKLKEKINEPPKR